MRRTQFTTALFLVTLPIFAQSDRGTITGTISDPAGAVVANAPIEVRNVDTGSAYQVGSSATGNYTVQVPTGNYEMAVAVSGFKRYVRQNIAVPVAQTLRIDVALEVGSNTESVTVTEAAPLLKTESGEMSHNVATDTLNSARDWSRRRGRHRDPQRVLGDEHHSGRQLVAEFVDPGERHGGELGRAPRGGSGRHQ
jgi:hypothetical protein